MVSLESQCSSAISIKTLQFTHQGVFARCVCKRNNLIYSNGMWSEFICCLHSFRRMYVKHSLNHFDYYRYYAKAKRFRAKTFRFANS